MPTVNLSLTFFSAASGSVTNPLSIYTDNGAEATYSWSGTSGINSCRYSTDFSSVVPPGATVTGFRYLIRCRKSNTATYPLPYIRWGTEGGGLGLGDYDLDTAEAQYVYPPTGNYTILPSTWSTIDIGATLSPAGSVSLFIDEFIVEVTYTEPSVTSIPVMFLGENF